jgi:RimJ/RimL family protein N-acetyltransferase
MFTPHSTSLRPSSAETIVPQLETERLRMRPFSSRDFDAYAEIVADPDVMRYIGNGQPLSRADAWRNLAMIVGHWQLRGHGLWAAEDKVDGALVGRVGLFNPEGWPGLELGWLLRRASWGKGYATEGARSAAAWAFSVLGCSRLLSLIRPGNFASVRVAERLGARLEGRTEVMGHEALVYVLDRDRPPL